MLFPLGQIVGTPGALEALEEAQQSPLVYINRHMAGDWGDLDHDDVASNNAALRYGNRILSAYVLPTGVKIWIITEADRSVSTILLPSEY